MSFYGQYRSKVRMEGATDPGLFYRGIVTASTASVQNYHGLLACRILLGVFEAATAPSLMMITGK